jgi:hypothetical protein
MWLNLFLKFILEEVGPTDSKLCPYSLSISYIYVLCPKKSEK